LGTLPTGLNPWRLRLKINRWERFTPSQRTEKEAEKTMMVAMRNLLPDLVNRAVAKSMTVFSTIPLSKASFAPPGTTWQKLGSKWG
jgi:hypothetical protein